MGHRIPGGGAECSAEPVIVFVNDYLFEFLARVAKYEMMKMTSAGAAVTRPNTIVAATDRAGTEPTN